MPPGDEAYKIGELRGEITGIKDDIGGLKTSQTKIFDKMETNHKEIVVEIQKVGTESHKKINDVEERVDDLETQTSPVVEAFNEEKEEQADTRRAKLDLRVLFIGGIAMAGLGWFVGRVPGIIKWLVK